MEGGRESAKRERERERERERDVLVFMARANVVCSPHNKAIWLEQRQG
jgi:hypothetical protein